MSLSFWRAEYTKLDSTCSACAMHHQAPALAMSVPVSVFVCISLPLRNTDTDTHTRTRAQQILNSSTLQVGNASGHVPARLSGHKRRARYAGTITMLYFILCFCMRQANIRRRAVAFKIREPKPGLTRFERGVACKSSSSLQASGHVA